MKSSLFTFLLFICFYSIGGQHQVVNPIIQNESSKLFSFYFPGLEISEEMRVACHLLYAEQILRAGKSEALSENQKLNRARIADLLHEYTLRGVYPKNYNYRGERAPCFIDQEGTICAVGYLIEQTAGHDVAVSINKEYQYADILEMDIEFIEVWANQNGITLEECAIIQPTYEWKISYAKSIHLEGIASLRPGANIFTGLSLMYYKLRWGNRYFGMTGAGLNYEFLKDGGFATGAKYVLGLKNNIRARPIMGLGTDYFYTPTRGGGINLTPELGIHSFFLIRNHFKLSAHLTYGYHIGIVNKANYSSQRHDISLGIGIGLPL
jgi:hypothetical protein